MSARSRGRSSGVGGITREQKMLVAAGANVVFIISLFLDWFGASASVGGTEIVSVGASGTDVVPSWWIPMVIAILAVVVLAAEGLYMELPVPTSSALGLYLSSIPLIVTVMIFLEISGKKFGVWLALIATIVATVMAALAWREDA